MLSHGWQLVGLKSIAASLDRKGDHRLGWDYVFDELQLLKRQLAESSFWLLSAYELGCVIESGQYYVPSIQYYTSALGWCLEPALSEQSRPLLHTFLRRSMNQLMFCFARPYTKPVSL